MFRTADDPKSDVSCPLPRSGDVLANKYLIHRVLGEGGMGIVYEAYHLTLEQRVAVKVLHPSLFAVPGAVGRFAREARASFCIRSPHVPRVLDVDTTATPYIVMDFLEGRDLAAELRARTALPFAEAVDLVLQACAGMSVAHASGIVHRDLKPANLFLATENRRRIVKVLDFGIAKFQGESDSHTAATPGNVGTPLYMSPEQVRSWREVDGRTDVWSLGIILYEIIAGALPFRGTTTAAIAAIVADATPSIRQARPDVPRAFERVLRRALAKTTTDRYPTVDALAAALRPFATEAGLRGPFSYAPSCGTRRDLRDLPEAPAGALRVIPIAPRRRRRNPWTTAGGIAAIVALSAAAMVLVSRVASHPNAAVFPAGAASASGQSSPSHSIHVLLPKFTAAL